MCHFVEQVVLWETPRLRKKANIETFKILPYLGTYGLAPTLSCVRIIM